MRIDASLSVMIWIFVTVRTPHCLEMKQVKVHVDVELLNQLYRDLTLVVGKRTVISVLACSITIWRKKGGAKLRLILIRVVKLLNVVMGLMAEVTVRANLRTLLGLTAITRLNVAANF
jgi:hypothetical protein